MKRVLSAVVLCVCAILASCGSENPPLDEYWKGGIFVRFKKGDNVLAKEFNYFVSRSIRNLNMETVKPGGYEASCVVTVLAFDSDPPKDIALSCDDYYLFREGNAGNVSWHFASEDDFIRGFSEFASGIEKKRKPAR